MVTTHPCQSSKLAPPTRTSSHGRCKARFVCFVANRDRGQQARSTCPSANSSVTILTGIGKVTDLEISRRLRGEMETHEIGETRLVAGSAEAGALLDLESRPGLTADAKRLSADAQPCEVKIFADIKWVSQTPAAPGLPAGSCTFHSMMMAPAAKHTSAGRKRAI